MAESDDVVKAAMTRRINTLFEALQLVEWNLGFHQGFCLLCGAHRSDGHRPVQAEAVGQDAFWQPCPIGYALSEEASAEPNADFVVTETFADGSRFLRYAQWQRAGTTSAGYRNEGQTKGDTR